MAIIPPDIMARPFAESGDKANIPDTTGTAGAASLTEGFPPVTQLPLSAGGIPPRRLDFNGVLNMLSRFAFWAQSGGQYRWNSTLDYSPPSMVFGSNGKVYFSLAPSGPGYSGVGPKDPTAAANQGTYWVSLTGYALEPATKNRLGGIIVGDGFTITAAGLLSVDPNSFSADLITELMKQLRLPQWLSSNKTFYVRPDGNDNNDGSANTATKAFKTIQAAVNYVSANFNVVNYVATIQVSAGTYTERVALPKYQSSTGNMRLYGDSKDTTIVIGCINSTASSGTWNIQDFTVKSDGQPGPGSSFNTSLLVVNDSASLNATNVKLLGDIQPVSEGGTTTGISVTGGTCVIGLVDIILADVAKGRSFISAATGGYVRMTQDCVLTGIQNNNTVLATDGSKFVRAGLAGQPLANFSGSVTGKRYAATFNSIINVSGGGENFIPGSSEGSVSTGSQYG